MRKKTIAVDFDGVLNSYESGWVGADQIPDGPTDGAIDWLCQMAADKRFTVVIFSSRNHQPGGVEAIQRWLLRWGCPEHVVLKELSYPTEKPPAHVTIDDRAWQFTGLFPEPDAVANFRPWWR